MTKKALTEKARGKNRRDFLKLAGTSAPAAAVALAAGADAAEAQPVDPTSETMQDTAHTRAYLDSARF
ncbi:twin-arginine translocation signal domain-containing protein [uncultured Tateyamaria sp.]|uniref:twin-arginine translocation signal domain-containing protein n=1 Tax=uncultured Tateyamaria sp. TaxID=455651 RepID=UPI00260A4982|nr:twin-arginine translocation signal domain-containing protein [uncultured Tateyamaria sp.]